MKLVITIAMKKITGIANPTKFNEGNAYFRKKHKRTVQSKVLLEHPDFIDHISNINERIQNEPWPSIFLINLEP